MAKTIYGLSKRDRDLVEATIQKMGAGKGILSRRPKPTRRRTGLGGGSNIRTGRVSTAIPAMTGITKALAGEGQVQFYDDDGVADGDPIDVINRKPEDYVVDQWADVDLSKSPPEVLWGSCATFPEPE